MNLLNQLVQIFKNFGALGRTRLMILGGVGALSIAIILAAALFVNKPAQKRFTSASTLPISTRSAWR